jgi:hypothetical protein
MPNDQHVRVIIEGITQAGKPFRPSDWAERLAGALSGFRLSASSQRQGAHIGYSPLCVPRTVDGVKCVIVDERLKSVEVMAWDFAIHFARDNNLRTRQIVGRPDFHSADKTSTPASKAVEAVKSEGRPVRG